MMKSNRTAVTASKIFVLQVVKLKSVEQKYDPEVFISPRKELKFLTKAFHSCYLTFFFCYYINIIIVSLNYPE